MAIFETLLSLFAGGLIGAWIADSQEINTWLKIAAIISIIVMIIFSCFRLLKLAHFPSNAIDYLAATVKVSELTKDLNRRKTINEYIDKAIQSLNLNTCPLTGEDYDHLCDSSVHDGLKTVLQPVIELPHYILDCSKSKFTVALHLVNYPEKTVLDGERKKLSFNESTKTVVFRDDFNISGNLTDDMLEELTFQGIQFQIQQLGLYSFNHLKLKDGIVDREEGKLKLIASPIPAVCEDDRIGILFIFCEDCVCPPNDIDNTLLIFGRIVANWVSKYKECILSRINAEG